MDTGCCSASCWAVLLLLGADADNTAKVALGCLLYMNHHMVLSGFVEDFFFRFILTVFRKTMVSGLLSLCKCINILLLLVASEASLSVVKGTGHSLFVLRRGV